MANYRKPGPDLRFRSLGQRGYDLRAMPLTHDHLELTGSPLQLDDVAEVARGGRQVCLSDSQKDVIARAHQAVDAVGQDDSCPVYGINTGFGSLSRSLIAPSDITSLQLNILRSHAAGVGEPLSEDVVRAMMLLLAASLSRGHSGVSCAVIEQILSLLNKGITPVIPSRGSVGASGDLAPLAHLGLVLIGEGEAWVDGRRMDGGAALEEQGLSPMPLGAKVGLALINGTHLMAAIGALSLVDLENILSAALLASAMGIDACRATDEFLDDRLHAVRCQSGQRRVASAMRALLKGSEIIHDHRQDDPRVQDPYSLRATPQVLGAVVDAVQYVRRVICAELGAVTDNPLVFPDSTKVGAAFLAGGNFHGMPLAMALDTLSIAICHMAGISERRVNWLLSGRDDQNPVTPFLASDPGLHSGLMIAQYTAAACCNELQCLASPASVGNVPTSAGIEDYNSMGATSAHQVRQAIDLSRHVIAIELMAMAEGLEHQRPLRSGHQVEIGHDVLRAAVEPLHADRSPAPDIEAVSKLIEVGGLRQFGQGLYAETLDHCD